MSDDGAVLGQGFGATTTAEEVTEGHDLSGSTWLVTGSNSGLGEETVRVLVKRGAHVVAGARTLEKAERSLRSLRLGPKSVTPVACELSDLSSVAEAVSAVRGFGRPLDGIIANAGIMALPQLRQVHGVELQFFVNHVGHFVLINALLEQLSPNGRVVMVSSGAHYLAHADGIEFDNLSGERDYDPWRMYGNSKLANILYAKSLARRFEGRSGQRMAYAIHPGVIRTNLARYIPDEEVEPMYAQIQKRVALKSIAQGAATQVMVATASTAPGENGAYFQDCSVSSTHRNAQDVVMADRLWGATEELVASL